MKNIYLDILINSLYVRACVNFLCVLQFPVLCINALKERSFFRWTVNWSDHFATKEWERACEAAKA